MPNDNKTKEFLKKLAPCIERGDLDACVEEAARAAGEMGVGAGEMLDLSSKEEIDHGFACVLALAAAQDLNGDDKAEAYVDAALASSELGLKRKEEEYYKKALQLDPKNPDAHYNYAILLEELGRKNEAEEYYKNVLELDPKNPDAHYNYAILLEELGRKNEAEEHYKKTLALDPKNPDVHDNYAIFLAKQRRKIEAEIHFRKAIELYPEDARTHSNYANFLLLNGRFLQAEKEVRIALRIEPNYPYALGTYGDILADEDYLEEAIEKYHEAIKNSDSMAYPAKAEIHNNLGWVHTHLEKYNRAKKEFEEANKLDPTNVKVIRNIRALRKVKSEPKISKMQWSIVIVLFIGVIATWYLFLTKKLTENIFMAQFIILIAILIFILFYHQLGKFKAGPIEFEKSTEHRSQPSEAIAKIER